jgi:hypothetical protein
MKPFDWYLKNDDGTLFAEDFPKDKYPFQVGDKVWIRRIDGGGCSEQGVNFIRNIQEVSNVIPMLGDDEALWSIELKGCPYIFDETDLIKS